jgi:superoxide reductase
VKNRGIVIMDKTIAGEEIKKPVDPENLTEGEKKHIPVIEAPEKVNAGEPFEVTVTVGSIPHVMDEKHYIEWIELYLHNKLMGRKELVPAPGEQASATFRIEAEEALIAVKEIETCRMHGVNICGNCGEKSVTTNLHALEHCNVHGVWEAYREIEVMSGEGEEGKKCAW